MKQSVIQLYSFFRCTRPTLLPVSWNIEHTVQEWLFHLMLYGDLLWIFFLFIRKETAQGQKYKQRERKKAAARCELLVGDNNLGVVDMQNTSHSFLSSTMLLATSLFSGVFLCAASKNVSFSPLSQHTKNNLRPSFLYVCNLFYFCYVIFSLLSIFFTIVSYSYSSFRLSPAT